MSCATAIKSGDTVYVGADSRFWYNTVSTLKENQSKVWKMKDFSIIFAVCGHLVDGNIISMSDGVIDERYKEKTIEFKDAVNIITPNIMSLLEQRGRIEYHSGIKKMQSDFLLAHRDRLFLISMESCVIEPDDDYIAIGSGQAVADGAFEAIKDDAKFNPQQKLVKILAAVCSKDAWVGYPVRIINTRNDDIIIIKNEEEAKKFLNI